VVKCWIVGRFLPILKARRQGSHIIEVLKETAQKEKTLLISVVNWGEVLYVIEQRHGKEKRDEIEHLMNQMHLEVIDADRDLTREATRLKANHKLPYADCFAAALANLRKATLLTGEKDLKIEWL